MKAVFLAALLAAPTPACAQQAAINLPLSTADQAVIIPLLCDAALYSYRMRFQDFCDMARVRLPEALKAEHDAAEKAKAEAAAKEPPP